MSWFRGSSPATAASGNAITKGRSAATNDLRSMFGSMSLGTNDVDVENDADLLVRRRGFAAG